jgi:uncharacterized protein YjbI with pentapeptide repeats
LVKTNLQGVNLKRAQLQRAILNMAQLQGAFLGRVQLQGADLNGANLQGVNLWEAQLQGADLSGAKLQGANLSKAQLQGADLSETQLQGVYIGSGFELITFQQRIRQQIDEPTEKTALEKQYTKLTEKQKSALIAELKKINNFSTKKAIERIKTASDTLDLSTAITGKYSEEYAEKWITDYHGVSKNYAT